MPDWLKPDTVNTVVLLIAFAAGKFIGDELAIITRWSDRKLNGKDK